jgi:hypothetical protein
VVAQTLPGKKHLIDPEDLARSNINRMILISLPILLGHIVNLFFAVTLYYFWMGFLAVAQGNKLALSFVAWLEICS